MYCNFGSGSKFNVFGSTTLPVTKGDMRMCPWSSGHLLLRLSPPPYQWPWPSPTGQQSSGAVAGFRDCHISLHHHATTNNGKLLGGGRGRRQKEGLGCSLYMVQNMSGGRPIFYRQKLYLKKYFCYRNCIAINDLYF